MSRVVHILAVEFHDVHEHLSCGACRGVGVKGGGLLVGIQSLGPALLFAVGVALLVEECSLLLI